MDTTELESHIEKTLLSSNHSPLADVIYRFITPDDGKMDTGLLEIIIEKTEKDEKKLMSSFVEQFGGVSASSEKKVATIEILITTVLDTFDAVREYDESILSEMYESTTDPKDINYMFEDLESRHQREADEEAESATDVEDVVEPEGEKDIDEGKQRLLDGLKGVRPKLDKLERKYEIELDERDIYQLWKD